MMTKILRVAVLFAVATLAAQTVVANKRCLENASNCNSVANMCRLADGENRRCLRCDVNQLYDLCVDQEERECEWVLSWDCGDQQRRYCDDADQCIGPWVTIRPCPSTGPEGAKDCN